MNQGIEFAQYRPYVQGDDFRSLDWKMYGKTGKYFIRQSDIDTETAFTFHIDNSQSMDYKEEGLSKLHLSKIIVSCLSYIATQQGDAFTWASLSNTIKLSSGLKHWNYSVSELYNLESSRSLQNNNDFLHPGIHFLLTDLYMPVESFKKKINSIVSKDRELVVIHLMGKNEENLSFPKDSKFIDLESNEHILLSSNQYRKQYKDRLQSHEKIIRDTCYEKNVLINKVYLQDDVLRVLKKLSIQINNSN